MLRHKKYLMFYSAPFVRNLSVTVLIPPIRPPSVLEFWGGLRGLKVVLMLFDFFAGRRPILSHLTTVHASADDRQPPDRAIGIRDRSTMH